MIKCFIQPFILGAIICGGLTYSIKLIAERMKLFDQPSPRKVHTSATPRLGGVAIILSFLLLVIGYSLASTRLHFDSNHILFFDQRLFGVVLGAIILMVAGVIDDIRGLKPWQKLIWQISAAISVVAFGITIDYIRLPAGYHIELTSWIINLQFWGQIFNISVWGDLLTIFWIVLLINTLNFLDGLDGLASGISFIAGLVVFFLSLALGQGASALLAIIFAGVVLGFIPWNFNPAKIFMGDSGSMFLGFMLAVLSVISGGKLATSFLVLGIPVLDVGWVVVRRLLSGHSPFQADKMHFHHRLLTTGLTQKQAVILLYLISAAFGAVAVLTSTQEKFKAIYWLVALMVSFAIGLIILEWKKRGKNAQ